MDQSIAVDPNPQVGRRWDFAAVWEEISLAVPERPAFEHGSWLETWSFFVERSARLAGYFQRAGLGLGSRVGVLLRNHPAWMETYLAALWLGAVPYNLNWRYRVPELAGVLDDAPADALVVGEEFAGTLLEALERSRSAGALVLEVSSSRARSSSSYEEALEHPRLARRDNTGEEVIDLYTGGTTGTPKAVMWRQADLWEALATFTGGPAPGVEEAVAAACSAPGPRTLIACPLMHGTGLFVALQTLSRGGTVITLPDPGYDPRRLLEAIRTHRPQILTIVGDAFARPLVEVLEAGGYDDSLESVVAVISSGVMWSAEIKRRLLRIAPGRLLVDALSSSEAIGVAASNAGAESVTGRFQAGNRTRVLDDHLRPCPPGEEGWIAIGPPNPIGYRNDPAKTASTFPLIDGERWCIPGDRARLEPDGTLILVGRDNACINTGGEKVHAEEVEEVLKLHPAVLDAAVVGLPDQRLGEVVAAVVELAPATPPGVGSPAPVDAEAIRAYVRERLAGYKVPAFVVFDSVERQASGKLDYPAVRSKVARLLQRG